MFPSRMEPKLFILIFKPSPSPAQLLAFLLLQPGSLGPAHFSTCTSLHSADSVSTLLAPRLCLHGAPCQAHPPTAHPLSKSYHCETWEATCELELKDKEELITGRALRWVGGGAGRLEQSGGQGGGEGRKVIEKLDFRCSFRPTRVGRLSLT